MYRYIVLEITTVQSSLKKKKLIIGFCRLLHALPFLTGTGRWRLGGWCRGRRPTSWARRCGRPGCRRSRRHWQSSAPQGPSGWRRRGGQCGSSASFPPTVGFLRRQKCARFDFNTKNLHSVWRPHPGEFPAKEGGGLLDHLSKEKFRITFRWLYILFLANTFLLRGTT